MGRTLSSKQREELLQTLEARFHEHQIRHPGLMWEAIEASLREQADKLYSLHLMEESGGEPDVIEYKLLFPKDDTESKDVISDNERTPFYFVDCSVESPAGRRSLCYDKEALEARKKNPPESSAKQMAEKMGVKLLDEAAYRALQLLGEFDLKTSSWILTPAEIRKRGGSLFCDRRYGQVFTYHNGADSYYASRGFRAVLEV